MNEDKFFGKTKCDRCGKDLKGFTMSWFTEEAICIDCSEKETQIKKKLPEGGKDYEGCGYLPEISKEWISE